MNGILLFTIEPFKPLIIPFKTTKIPINKLEFTFYHIAGILVVNGIINGMVMGNGRNIGSAMVLKGIGQVIDVYNLILMNNSL